MNMWRQMILLMMVIMFMFYFFMTSFMMKWLMLEFEVMLFLIYLNLSNLNKLISMIYLSISFISSIIMILILSYMYMYMIESLMMNFLLVMVMFLKLGMFPFSYWMIFLYDNLNWFEIFLSSTIMKFVPILILLDFLSFEKEMIFLIILNCLFSSIYSFMDLSFKKIIACSSINHTSFFLLIGMVDKILFLIFMLTYSVIFYNLLKIFYIDNLKSKFFKDYIYIFLIMVNYMMLPPFFSMMYKWIFVMKNLLFSLSMGLFIFLFLLTSLILNYNYLKLVEKNFMQYFKYKFIYIFDIYNFFFIIMFMFMSFFLVNLII